MGYLISQMLFCLLAAALLGFLLGWWMRGTRCRRELDDLERSWRERWDAERVEVNTLHTAAPTGIDDLTRIEGVGPKIAELLQAAGYSSFAGVAAAGGEALKQVLDNAGERFQMHDPTTWPEQARLAAEGRWRELEELQDRLDGGKLG